MITTSWTGSRLWDLTKETNKSLLKIWWKEIISHIIDSYPIDIEIVVTLWYFWEKVRAFLVDKYPDRKIHYAHVNPYEGLWSSLWYSMLCAKEFLQCPFIFHCNDTIVNQYLPLSNQNWAWWYKVLDASQYTTFKTDGKTIVFYNKLKWASNFDYAHIWVVWIHEYKKFRNILDSLYKDNPNNTSLNDVYVLYEMIASWSNIGFIEFKEWLDTWNPDSLKLSAQKILSL